jgi:hypothetical protein
MDSEVDVLFFMHHSVFDLLMLIYKHHRLIQTLNEASNNDLHIST